jgi:hypothetical protein
LHGKHLRLTHFARKKERKKERKDPNGMPKTLMPSDGQQKMVGGKKLGGKPKGDQVEHLWGWTKSPTKAN